ncbi:unnamed protein product, partial [Durusdinium trenchii]
ARGALRPSFERLCHALLPPDSRRSADLPLQSALEAVEAEGKSLELPKLGLVERWERSGSDWILGHWYL